MLISRQDPCGYQGNERRSSIFCFLSEAICGWMPVDAGRQEGWRNSGNSGGGRLGQRVSVDRVTWLGPLSVIYSDNVQSELLVTATHSAIMWTG